MRHGGTIITNFNCKGFNLGMYSYINKFLCHNSVNLISQCAKGARFAISTMTKGAWFAINTMTKGACFAVSTMTKGARFAINTMTFLLTCLGQGGHTGHYSSLA